MFVNNNNNNDPMKGFKMELRYKDREDYKKREMRGRRSGGGETKEKEGGRWGLWEVERAV